MKKRPFLPSRFRPDALFCTLMGLFLVLTVLGAIFSSLVLLLLAVPFAALTLWRFFSVNYPARQKENRVFLLVVTAPVRGVVRLAEKMDRRYYSFHCPGCNAPLRVPRKAGRHTVTCPDCGMKIPLDIR